MDSIIDVDKMNGMDWDEVADPSTHTEHDRDKTETNKHTTKMNTKTNKTKQHEISASMKCETKKKTKQK